MKNLKEKHKLIVTIVLLVGLLSTLGYYLNEAQKALESEETNLANKTAELSRAESQVASIPRLRQEIKGLQSDIAQTERQLPSGKEVEIMLTEIQELLVETGLRLSSLQPSQAAVSRSRRAPAARSQGYVKHQFKISMTGDYHQLAAFVSGLENMKRFTSLEKLALTNNEDKLKVAMTIVTYEFKK